jgi:hypothetical protein
MKRVIVCLFIIHSPDKECPYFSKYSVYRILSSWLRISALRHFFIKFRNCSGKICSFRRNLSKSLRLLDVTLSNASENDLSFLIRIYNSNRFNAQITTMYVRFLRSEIFFIFKNSSKSSKNDCFCPASFTVGVYLSLL